MYIFSNGITASNLGNMKKSGNDKCSRCRIELKESDQCYHRTGKKPIWFHKDCYEKLRQI